MSNARNNQKVGVLFAGLGSISSTLIAGVEAIKKGMAAPVGSQALLGVLRQNGQPRKICDIFPLAKLDDLVFGAWDIFPDSCYEAALHAKVVGPEILAQLRPLLEKIQPFRAVFDPSSQRILRSTHVKSPSSKKEWIAQLRRDIQEFKKSRGVSRLVLVISSSTEICKPATLSRSPKEFQTALSQNAAWISPSVAYAAAAIEEGVPCINATPSLGFDSPYLLSRARELDVPLTGKDLKTGQTMLKTALAPALKIRMLGLKGWYSTNILGNRDGEVLSDPESSRTKILSKQAVLPTILDAKLYPELYADYDHQVHIDYYPPRGDNKEAWDNIDIFGWLGYPMQIKLNFLCRDSVLAAPLLLDLILFADLAKRMGRGGVQTWLSLYHKSPVCEEPGNRVHDLFLQYSEFEKVLGQLASELPKEKSSRAVVLGK